MPFISYIQQTIDLFLKFTLNLISLIMQVAESSKMSKDFLTEKK
jgi:hypothetical protein